MNKQDYLKLVKKRQSEQVAAGELISLAMPTGAVWKILPLKTAQYAISGKMPLHLLANLSSLKNAPKDLEKDLTGADVLNLLTMVSDAFLNNVVEPKITLIETDDSITPEQVDPADFEYFRDYIISGGQSTLGKPLRSSPK